MDKDQLAEVHQECTDSLATWVREATLTCKMLEVVGSPLTIKERSALSQQRSIENESQYKHQEARQRLFDLIKTKNLVYGDLPE